MVDYHVHQLTSPNKGSRLLMPFLQLSVHRLESLIFPKSTLSVSSERFVWKTLHSQLESHCDQFDNVAELIDDDYNIEHHWSTVRFPH